LVDRIVALGFVGRRPGATDGRAIQLTLTPEGERLAREVAAIESAMYATIDALAGPDIDVSLEFLRAFVDGSPSGQALARRIDLSE
jgi:DNA-binding MarR family transcriptional regulator